MVLARFVPVVRTFLNPAAGIARMPAQRFLVANLLGGVVWAGGVTLAGYLLGKTFHNVDRYLLPIIGVIVAVSLLPVVVELLREKRRNSREPDH